MRGSARMDMGWSKKEISNVPPIKYSKFENDNKIMINEIMVAREVIRIDSTKNCLKRSFLDAPIAFLTDTSLCCMEIWAVVRLTKLDNASNKIIIPMARRT